MSVVTLLEKTPNLVGVVCVWCFLFCDGGCLVGFVLFWVGVFGGNFSLHFEVPKVCETRLIILTSVRSIRKHVEEACCIPGSHYLLP